MVPLMNGKLSTGTIQVIDYTCNGEEFHLVIPWASRHVLPHEFFCYSSCNFPCSLTALNRGLYQPPQWESNDESDHSEIVEAAQRQQSNLLKDLTWIWTNGQSSIEIEWGFQAIPLDQGKYLLNIKTAQSSFWVSKFGLDWFVAREMEFKSFASGLRSTPQVSRGILNTS